MTERRRNPRRISAALDLVHPVIGGLVVILAVMAFLDPQAHPVFFPLIFFLAALLSCINGGVRIATAGRDHKRQAAGIAAGAAGVVCAALGAVSAVIML